MAIDQSSQFNKAYTTLVNPLSRAKYLVSRSRCIASARTTLYRGLCLDSQLDQYGYDISESDSLTDPDLLMEVMEAREELEDASTQEECDAVRESNRGEQAGAFGKDYHILPFADDA